MAISAGYNCTIKIPGTSTTFTDEATTHLTGNQYQITSTSKRVWDYTATFVVKDGGTPIAVTGYTIDALFGIVNLNSPPGGAVTVSGKYFPMLAIAAGTSADADVSFAKLATDNFDNAGEGSSIAGVRQAKATTEHLEALDASIGATDLLTLFNGRSPVLLEVNFVNFYFRGWMRLYGEKTSVKDTDLRKEALTWEQASQALAGRTDIAGARFGT